MVEQEVKLSDELVKQIHSMKKDELVQALTDMAVQKHVLELRCQTVLETERRVSAEKEKLAKRLEQSEESVEQAHAMLETVMDRWHKYRN